MYDYDFEKSKAVYITSQQFIKTKLVVKMPPSSHEEADTQILVHIMHCLEQGKPRIQVSAVDTDVIVILVGKFFQIQEFVPDVDISVAFGKGK